MSLTKEGRKILKMSAAKLVEQKEEIERLKKEAKRRDLVDDIMDQLQKESLVTSFNEQEKRAKLESLEPDRLEDIKNTITNYVRTTSIKLGEVREGPATGEDADPITEWLLNDI